ncbi:MAG: hypothetical protein KME32_34520 [Mojavia pulchra JT2-VF2]|uniref:Uncharacterized protein n=1 Tax=Mojavia pulchra JT2-VF2 TaxID=287848 RepID=A0A951Q5C6_9NOST|nr:hypothetical protein [Mojavia pulchra JT2-VF2]
MRANVSQASCAVGAGGAGEAGEALGRKLRSQERPHKEVAPNRWVKLLINQAF